MVWAVRARTDSIRTPGRPLRDSGVELMMLAFIECKNGLHEPTAKTAEETEADLPATETGSGRIRAYPDWLAHGLDGRSPETATKNQNMLEPILAVIGAGKLRDLTAADVRQALAAMAAGYSTAAVSMGHLALKRTIRHAEANDLISRNVASLADTPKG
jgi:hypothetical protein